MFDRTINGVNQTYEDKQSSSSYELLGRSLYNQIIEENPIENLEAGIIEMGKPLDLNNIIEVPTYSRISAGAHLTSTPTRDRSQTQAHNNYNLQNTMNRFGRRN